LRTSVFEVNSSGCVWFTVIVLPPTGRIAKRYRLCRRAAQAPKHTARSQWSPDQAYLCKRRHL
jgi:hypothetical protein